MLLDHAYVVESIVENWSREILTAILHISVPFVNYLCVCDSYLRIKQSVTQ